MAKFYSAVHTSDVLHLYRFFLYKQKIVYIMHTVHKPTLQLQNPFQKQAAVCAAEVKSTAVDARKV